MKKAIQLLVLLNSIILPQFLSAYDYTVRNGHEKDFNVTFTFSNGTSSGLYAQAGGLPGQKSSLSCVAGITVTATDGNPSRHFNFSKNDGCRNVQIIIQSNGEIKEGIPRKRPR